MKWLALPCGALGLLILLVPGTISPARADSKKQPAATQVVEAEGTGRTVVEARRDAIRAAVRKAAGAVVLGELTVERDRVIRDRVLLYSDGIIAPGGYQEMKRTRDGALWVLRIRARVVGRQLARRLEAAGLATREIDGQGLAATVLSRTEARKQGAELVGKVVGELPELLTAQAVPPTASDYDEDSGRLRLSVRVSVDPRQYQRWVRRAATLLDRASTSRSRLVFEAPRGYPGSRPTDLQSELLLGVRRLSHAHAEGKSWFLWVLQESGTNLQSSAWLVYRLDCSQTSLNTVLTRQPSLLVTLLDGKGKPIAVRGPLPLPHTVQPHMKYRHDRHGKWFWFQPPRSWSEPGQSKLNVPEHLFLAPLHFSPGLARLHFNQQEQIKLEVPLSTKELARLRQVECSVSWEQAPASSSSVRPASGKSRGVSK